MLTFFTQAVRNSFLNVIIQFKFKKIFITIEAILLYCFLLLSSCDKTSFSVKDDYYKYLNCSNNGLIQINEENGFIFKSIYIPHQLCALEEYSFGFNKLPLDSLVYQNSFCKSFSFSIEASSSNKIKDVRFYGIHNTEEFNRRQYEIDFHLNEYFYLIIGENKIYPQLVVADNRMDLSTQLSIRLKFVAESLDSPLLIEKNFKLVFNDPFFDTGRNEFYFKKENINSIPKLKRIH